MGLEANAQGRRRPQRLQRASCPRKQESQMSGWPFRARTAIRRVRPHLPQIRCGRSAHRAQTDWPCSSRPATGLTTPQRTHAVASCRRRQRAHTPPAVDRVSGLPVRAHRAQTGWGRSTPRARSSVTRRPTTGGAPMVSASGSVARAAANDRMTAGWPATASSAACSTCVGILGIAASTAVLIRLRPQPLHNRPLAQAKQPVHLAGIGFQRSVSGSTRARVGRCGVGGPAGSRRVGRERVTR